MTRTLITTTPTAVVPGAGLPDLSAGLLTALVFTCAAATANVGIAPEPIIRDALLPEPVHSGTARNIVDALTRRHYLNLVLDDAVSSRVLDRYLNELDPARSYFLASDIDEFEKYRSRLDNALHAGNLMPAFAIFNRYQERAINQFENTLKLLNDEGLDQFDFSVDESLELDREDAPWATTQAEMDDLWRRRLKSEILNLMLTDKPNEEILELIVKRVNNRLSRRLQTNAEDVFQVFMNSFTKIYDPHTGYFSPRNSENFNIEMRLSLEGIGAVLVREDDYTKVVSLVPEGPADKADVLEPNDLIVGVGQGASGDITDVIGWRLDEVVDLIRGPKNTVVRLQVRSADTDGTQVVQITRNTVKLEDQSAKSEVIEIEQFGATHKIGVIDVPAFYVDLAAYARGEADFRSTTRDVRRLLTELEDEDVSGIIIDLRDNTGGGLDEARTMVGLFIEYGPTVQVRDQRQDEIMIYRDTDIMTAYDGPLAVLVNRGSASASEIFAGAIQDYGRGVVLGSQTFGKGSVQQLLALNHGQLKVTQAMFYRINGESVQHRGVIPDIVYPSRYNLELVGENTLEDSLPYAEIPSTIYRPHGKIGELIPELTTRHNKRVSVDPEYQYVADAVAYRHELSNREAISLNKETRLSEKEDNNQFWLSLENRKRVAQGLPEIDSLDELSSSSDSSDDTQTEVVTGEQDTAAAILANATPDSDGEEAVDTETTEVATVDESITEEETPPPDVYIRAAGNVLLDILSLSTRTAERVDNERRWGSAQ